MTLHVYDAAREFPDRPALMVEGSTFTWEDLEGILAPMMIDLLDRGVYPGTHTPVSIVGTNTLDTLQRLLCLITAGVPAQLIHPALTGPERQRLLDAIEPIDAPNVQRSPDDPPMARGSLNFPDIDARDEHPLAIVYTSGSSGFPKGVILSRRAFVWSARASEKNLGWHDDDRWLLRIPIAHIGGLSTVTRCLLARRCMVLGDDAHPPARADRARPRNHRVAGADAAAQAHRRSARTGVRPRTCARCCSAARPLRPSCSPMPPIAAGPCSRPTGSPRRARRSRRRSPAP